MKVEDMKKVSLALQENAKDFIEKGLSYIIEGEEKDCKYSLLHIFSGTLLFLKDVLYNEHWSFLFQKIDEAKKSDLIENKINSVNFSTLLKRLDTLTNVKLDKDLIKDLEWMQKERNKIEHFYNPINYYEVQSRIASLLGNLITLINNLHKSDPDFVFEEDYDYEHKYQSLFQVLQTYSLEFDKYIEQRSLHIKKKLESCDCVIYCPSCNQKALEINKNSKLTVCHFCLSEHTIEMFYNKFNPIHFDFEIQDIAYSYTCPECDSDKLFEDITEYICFECFKRYKHNEISSCIRCAATTYTSKTICDDCFEDIMSE